MRNVAEKVRMLTSPSCHANLHTALAKRFASKSSHVLVFSFQTWRSTLSSHKKAHERAIQHHASHVQHNAWFAWRIQLQETAKMNKKARLTEVYFLLRRTWHKMGMVHEQRVLEKKLAGFSARKMGKVFQGASINCLSTRLLIV